MGQKMFFKEPKGKIMFFTIDAFHLFLEPAKGKDTIQIPIDESLDLFIQFFPCKVQLFLLAQGKVPGFFEDKIKGAFYFSQNSASCLIFIRLTTKLF
jgi:hypothetical protein